MIIEIASKMVLCLVIASLIGFVIGFLLGRVQKKDKLSSVYSYGDYKVHGNIYNRPIILSKPRPTGKDDLKQIEGIDLKLEQELNRLGIFHFDQIAKWNNKNCEWVDKYLSLENKIEENKWIEKASELSHHNNKK